MYLLSTNGNMPSRRHARAHQTCLDAAVTPIADVVEPYCKPLSTGASCSSRRQLRLLRLLPNRASVTLSLSCENYGQDNAISFSTFLAGWGLAASIVPHVFAGASCGRRR